MRLAAPFSPCLASPGQTADRAAFDHGAIPGVPGWPVPGSGKSIRPSQGPRWRHLLRFPSPSLGLERSSRSRSQHGHAPTGSSSVPGGGREAAQSAFKWGYLKPEPGGKRRNQFPKWEGGVLFLYIIGSAA